LSSNWPENVARLVLAEVDSTNAHALREAPHHAGPVWFLGLRQTAGRGRRGRAWADPAGNFAATYLCRPDGPPEQAAQRSFVAALALYDALLGLVGGPQALALKWPNDVLLNGGKVAGILLESAGAGVTHLAVGIGVNLLNAPEGLDNPHPPVSMLAETGLRVTPEAFLDLLAPAFAHWEGQLKTHGFAPIRTAWLARAARLGQPITARTVTETLTGTFDGIDASGALVLTMPQERRIIPAADVFFQG
jgi:BirA family transcriptional regulator, biotin operon repressor / biotin---[acetyl-CoA-carboxylase] ligase